jgi:hypothetical protein
MQKKNDLETLQGRDQLGDLDVSGRITLRSILKKYG